VVQITIPTPQTLGELFAARDLLIQFQSTVAVERTVDIATRWDTEAVPYLEEGLGVSIAKVPYGTRLPAGVVDKVLAIIAE
jgi:hypothetical protein